MVKGAISNLVGHIYISGSQKSCIYLAPFGRNMQYGLWIDPKFSFKVGSSGCCFLNLANDEHFFFKPGKIPLKGHQGL